MSKNALFISHAAPEDNAFTRWLGAKLELAGYRVWHDLDQLKGGDLFWDKIEAAIRGEAIRMIAVVSKVSIHKSGVKNEWAVGATLERAQPGFIIPVCIDEGFDFSTLPIEIHRKNVLGFGAGWHKGLKALLDTLAEAGVPRIAAPDPSVALHWLPETKAGAILRTDKEEILDSNWLRITALPPTLESARILGTERKVKVNDENRAIPWFEHENLIVGFAKAADLVSLMQNTVMLKAANAVDSEAFLESGSTLGTQAVRPSEARKRVANLVRQAWELTMEAKGLGSHDQSGGRRVFFVTPELTKGLGERVAFIDVDGKQRRKALNGRSEKRKANWCYAVGMVPAFDKPWRIELRSTIVFTDDDGKPLDSTARAHRLRMSFCRSWWNDRWRGFLRAFLALVAEGQPELRLPVGSGRFIVVAAEPIQFAAPVGLSDLAPSIDLDPVDEHEEDEADFDDEDDEGAPQ